MEERASRTQEKRFSCCMCCFLVFCSSPSMSINFYLALTLLQLCNLAPRLMRRSVVIKARVKTSANQSRARKSSSIAKLQHIPGPAHSTSIIA